METDETTPVLESLRKLRCPAYNSVWIGPFEQLVGAGYALLLATRHGISGRNLENYNPRVQSQIISHIENNFLGRGGKDSRDFADWASGFYFNSAIQRIVWAGERLLLTCAGTSCSCRKRNAEGAVSRERPDFPKILKGAMTRLDHVQNDHAINLSHCRAVMEQFNFQDSFGKKREYRRGDPLDEAKILAMLRYDINNRKHRIYGRSLLLDRNSAGKGDRKTWHSSGADYQMALACRAFQFVCDAYEELHAWNPRAQKC